MCLGIPGKVIELFDLNGLKMGKINYGDTVNEVCLEYVPEIEVGQYTIVHAGFGISIIDEKEAQKTLDVWEEMITTASREGKDIFGNALPDSDIPK